MSSPNAVIDLDDTGALLEADRQGLLRASAMAGAQVRAVAGAVAEGLLASVADGQRPRSVIWVSGRGAAGAAGEILTAALAGITGEPLVLAAQSPSWIGPLDLLVVAGEDPADPVLVSAAATAVKRGARVVVAAPYEGPLREATADRAAVLAPRLPVPAEFGLCRYLAAGLAAVSAVDPALRVDLDLLADELDAEALRNSTSREVFTNPAKALAVRMTDRQVVLAADSAAVLGLARHGAAVLLRLAARSAAAVGIDDAVAALAAGPASGFSDPVDALFHDEQIDGPLPSRLRVIALALSTERPLLAARLAGMAAEPVDLLVAEDVGDAASALAAGSPIEVQLATLAVRLEMAAVYLRLAGG